jgi:hypothetical protein
MAAELLPFIWDSCVTWYSQAGPKDTGGDLIDRGPNDS